MKMPFGKYKGEEVCDVPLHYIKWAEEQAFIDMYPGLRAELQHEIEKAEGDRPGKGFVKRG